MTVKGATFKRADLVEQVCLKTDLPQKDAELIIMSIMAHIKEALIRGETVKINGFGVFSIVQRKETIGRNVKAGLIVKIPCRNAVVFKPSDAMKKRVDSSLRKI